MGARFTEKDLFDKGFNIGPGGIAKKVGKVADRFKEPKDKKKAVAKAKTSNTGGFSMDGKSFIEYALIAAKVKYEKEHRFDKVRKFRFDFAIPEKMVALEYDGLMSEKSRHTTIQGFTTDCDKTNLAQILGWRVLRYTARNYKGVVNDLKRILE